MNLLELRRSILEDMQIYLVLWKCILLQKLLLNPERTKKMNFQMRLHY